MSDPPPPQDGEPELGHRGGRGRSTEGGSGLGRSSAPDVDKVIRSPHSIYFSEN